MMDDLGDGGDETDGDANGSANDGLVTNGSNSFTLICTVGSAAVIVVVLLFNMIPSSSGAASKDATDRLSNF